MIKSEKLTEITRNWKINVGVVIVVDASNINGLSLSCAGTTPINPDGIEEIAQDLLKIAGDIRKDPDFNKTT